MQLRELITFLLVILSFTAWSQEEITDQEMSDAIETEYDMDHAIDVNKINVMVNDGIAELTGTVNNLKAKERATRIAEMVKGVRAVSNRIDISPAVNWTDKGLQRKVNMALDNDPATESYQVEVSADASAITLTGTVDSYREKELAGNVAASVAGVTDVTNQITINYDTERSGEELEQEIRAALKWSTLVDDAMVEVSVDDANVKLSGVVGSAAEKSNARYIAWVSGVKEVDVSDLDVKWYAKDEKLQRAKKEFAEDDKIEKAIKDALVYDPRVHSFNVKVESDEGWVSLRGSVENLMARKAARNIAKNTMGVKGVTNRIKVEIEMPPTDGEMAEDIKNALSWNAVTESYEIDVDITSGIVTLSGNVDSYLEKKEAEWVASSVEGVVDVNNLLTVNYPYSYYWWDASPFYEWYYLPSENAELITLDQPDDETIKRNVEAQLWWSSYVETDQVRVTVDNGVVTLKGKVDSMREYQEAAKNAWEGGAWSVNNDLKID